MPIKILFLPATQKWCCSILYGIQAVTAALRCLCIGALKWITMVIPDTSIPDSWEPVKLPLLTQGLRANYFRTARHLLDHTRPVKINKADIKSRLLRLITARGFSLVGSLVGPTKSSTMLYFCYLITQ